MNVRDALTIRFPPELLARAKDAKHDNESLNELVIAAVDREVRRRNALSAHEQIMEIRRRVASRTGPQPNSAPLIRQLREGIGRRD